MKKKIYMDYAAATPVDERVAKAMEKYLSTEFGNPGSIHSFGVCASKAVDESRKKVANVLNCRPQEIVFTSGGTEGDNLAIFGVAKAYRGCMGGGCGGRGCGHIITSVIEHPAVLSPCRALEREGFEVTYVPVNKEGIVDPKEVHKALRPDTFLVSIMYANNEIGTIQPISEIAKVIRHHRSTITNYSLTTTNYPLLHADACQAPGALSLNVAKLGVDLMTISGAKIYGPKGIGVLYIKSGVLIEPLFYGGGQEGGVRSGTENVGSIVGFGEAIVLSEDMREKECRRLTNLRDYFAKELKTKFPDIEINGSLKARLPNNLSVYLPNIDSEQLVIELDAIGVAVSAGSACHAKGSGGSHVIWALTEDPKKVMGSVRFTFGRGTTKEDIDFVLESLPEILKRIRI